MAKLVTVVEIVKRNAPCSASALASELSIGNTATSPCSRRPHSAQAQAQALDLADTERKQSKGIYDLKALVTGKQSTAASEEEKEEEKESKTDAKIKPNEQPWLQAKLWIREPSS
ncbi:hypothetical protein LPJ57_000141 [Coemansia sp. RSA 486]|nr:hypothetical protein LPJ57_000141 [Coemansia sp. RSA 486]KAJ2603303.1 hypothetical protein GGF39_000256 [Coemansia sp. RSA 1721]